MVDLPGESLVFLRVRPGKVDEALKELRKNPSVRISQPTLGPYDVVATVHFKDDRALRTFSQGLHAKEFCEGVQTLPSFRQWTREGAVEKPLSGWALIQARNSDAAMEALQRVATVSRVFEVPGDFNLVAHLTTEDPARLMEAVTRDIHKIEGVQRTQTFTGLPGPRAK